MSIRDKSLGIRISVFILQQTIVVLGILVLGSKSLVDVPFLVFLVFFIGGGIWSAYTYNRFFSRRVKDING